MIGQLIRVEAGWRKVLGKFLADTGNRMLEPVRNATSADLGREIIHDLLPRAFLDARIDGAIGDDLDALFRNRHENQNARPPGRRMQILREELLARPSPCVGS